MIRSLFALLVGLVCSSTAFAQVSVTGSGEVKTTPDAARFHVSVVTNDVNASKAMKSANENTASVFAALGKFEINKNDISTSSVNVFQGYDNQGKLKDAYTATNTIIVTVRDLDKLGDVMGAVVKGGSNNVGSLQFVCTKNLDVLSDQARELAIADARRKAEVYAKAGGFRLGGVATLTEHQENMYHERGFVAPAAARSVDPGTVPVAVGQRGIKVNVQVTFAIDKATPPALLPTPVVR